MKHQGALALVGILTTAACGGGGGGSGDDDDTPPVIDAPSGATDAATADAPIAIDAPLAIDAALPDAPPAPQFVRHTIDAMADGPAYAAVADVDKDGTLDVVVAHFGTIAGLAIPNGKVTLYKRGADLATWTRSDIVPATAGVKFPGQPTFVDVDGDLDLDMLLPSGFLACAAIPGGAACGGLGWYEQNAGTWTRRDVVPLGNANFYHHAELVDFDGDGLKDLVTAGEQGGFSASATAQWFKGTATGVRFETTPRSIGAGGGSFPRVLDIDGDGDLDVASAQFFVTPSFVWFERTAAPSAGNPNGTFVRHTINSDMGKSIMMTVVDDLYGDGVRRYVGANHTNRTSNAQDPESAVAVFTPGADKTQPWPKTKISGAITSRANMGFAQNGAPGVFGVGDMDDDGRLDLVVSGDGDENVYFLKQTAPGQFSQSVLQGGLGQAGGAVVHDLDGDGKHDTIVTGYEDNVVYLFTH